MPASTKSKLNSEKITPKSLIGSQGKGSIFNFGQSNSGMKVVGGTGGIMGSGSKGAPPGSKSNYSYLQLSSLQMNASL